jgi:hypothetical protein
MSDIEDSSSSDKEEKNVMNSMAQFLRRGQLNFNQLKNRKNLNKNIENLLNKITKQQSLIVQETSTTSKPIETNKETNVDLFSSKELIADLIFEPQSLKASLSNNQDLSILEKLNNGLDKNGKEADQIKTSTESIVEYLSKQSSSSSEPSHNELDVLLEIDGRNNAFISKFIKKLTSK